MEVRIEYIDVLLSIFEQLRSYHETYGQPHELGLVNDVLQALEAALPVQLRFEPAICKLVRERLHWRILYDYMRGVVFAPTTTLHKIAPTMSSQICRSLVVLAQTCSRFWDPIPTAKEVLAEFGPYLDPESLHSDYSIAFLRLFIPTHPSAAHLYIHQLFTLAHAYTNTGDSDALFKVTLCIDVICRVIMAQSEYEEALAFGGVLDETTTPCPPVYGSDGHIRYTPTHPSVQKALELTNGLILETVRREAGEDALSASTTPETLPPALKLDLPNRIDIRPYLPILYDILTAVISDTRLSASVLAPEALALATSDLWDPTTEGNNKLIIEVAEILARTLGREPNSNKHNADSNDHIGASGVKSKKPAGAADESGHAQAHSDAALMTRVNGNFTILSATKGETPAIPLAESQQATGDLKSDPELPAECTRVPMQLLKEFLNRHSQLINQGEDAGATFANFVFRLTLSYCVILTSQENSRNLFGDVAPDRIELKKHLLDETDLTFARLVVPIILRGWLRNEGMMSNSCGSAMIIFIDAFPEEIAPVVVQTVFASLAASENPEQIQTTLDILAVAMQSLIHPKAFRSSEFIHMFPELLNRLIELIDASNLQSFSSILVCFSKVFSAIPFIPAKLAYEGYEQFKALRAERAQKLGIQLPKNGECLLDPDEEGMKFGGSSAVARAAGYYLPGKRATHAAEQSDDSAMVDSTESKTEETKDELQLRERQRAFDVALIPGNADWCNELRDFTSQFEALALKFFERVLDVTKDCDTAAAESLLGNLSQSLSAFFASLHSDIYDKVIDRFLEFTLANHYPNSVQVYCLILRLALGARPVVVLDKVFPAYYAKIARVMSDNERVRPRLQSAAPVPTKGLAAAVSEATHTICIPTPTPRADGASKFTWSSPLASRQGQCPTEDVTVTTSLAPSELLWYLELIGETVTNNGAALVPYLEKIVIVYRLAVSYPKQTGLMRQSALNLFTNAMSSISNMALLESRVYRPSRWIRADPRALEQLERASGEDLSALLFDVDDARAAGDGPWEHWKLWGLPTDATTQPFFSPAHTWTRPQGSAPNVGELPPYFPSSQKTRNAITDGPTFETLPGVVVPTCISGVGAVYYLPSEATHQAAAQFAEMILLGGLKALSDFSVNPYSESRRRAAKEQLSKRTMEQLQASSSTSDLPVSGHSSKATGAPVIAGASALLDLPAEGEESTDDEIMKTPVKLKAKSKRKKGTRKRLCMDIAEGDEQDTEEEEVDNDLEVDTEEDEDDELPEGLASPSLTRQLSSQKDAAARRMSKPTLTRTLSGSLVQSEVPLVRIASGSGDLTLTSTPSQPPASIVTPVQATQSSVLKSALTPKRATSTGVSDFTLWTDDLALYTEEMHRMCFAAGSTLGGYRATDPGRYRAEVVDKFEAIVSPKPAWAEPSTSGAPSRIGRKEPTHSHLDHHGGRSEHACHGHGHGAHHTRYITASKLSSTVDAGGFPRARFAHSPFAPFTYERQVTTRLASHSGRIIRSVPVPESVYAAIAPEELKRPVEQRASWRDLILELSLRLASTLAIVSQSPRAPASIAASLVTIMNILIDISRGDAAEQLDTSAFLIITRGMRRSALCALELERRMMSGQTCVSASAMLPYTPLNGAERSTTLSCIRTCNAMTEYNAIAQYISQINSLDLQDAYHYNAHVRFISPLLLTLAMHPVSAVSEIAAQALEAHVMAFPQDLPPVAEFLVTVVKTPTPALLAAYQGMKPERAAMLPARPTAFVLHAIEVEDIEESYAAAAPPETMALLIDPVKDESSKGSRANPVDVLKSLDSFDLAATEVDPPGPHKYSLETLIVYIFLGQAAGTDLFDISEEDRKVIDPTHAVKQLGAARKVGTKSRKPLAGRGKLRKNRRQSRTYKTKLRKRPAASTLLAQQALERSRVTTSLRLLSTFACQYQSIQLAAMDALLFRCEQHKDEEIQAEVQNAFLELITNLVSVPMAVPKPTGDLVPLDRAVIQRSLLSDTLRQWVALHSLLVRLMQSLPAAMDEEDMYEELDESVLPDEMQEALRKAKADAKKAKGEQTENVEEEEDSEPELLDESMTTEGKGSQLRQETRRAVSRAKAVTKKLAELRRQQSQSGADGAATPDVSEGLASPTSVRPMGDSLLFAGTTLSGRSSHKKKSKKKTEEKTKKKREAEARAKQAARTEEQARRERRKAREAARQAAAADGEESDPDAAELQRMGDNMNDVMAAMTAALSAKGFNETTDEGEEDDEIEEDDELQGSALSLESQEATEKAHWRYVTMRIAAIVALLPSKSTHFYSPDDLGALGPDVIVEASKRPLSPMDLPVDSLLAPLPNERQRSLLALGTQCAMVGEALDTLNFRFTAQAILLFDPAIEVSDSVRRIALVAIARILAAVESASSLYTSTLFTNDHFTCGRFDAKKAFPLVPNMPTPAPHPGDIRWQRFHHVIGGQNAFPVPWPAEAAEGLLELLMSETTSYAANNPLPGEFANLTVDGEGQETEGAEGDEEAKVASPPAPDSGVAVVTDETGEEALEIDTSSLLKRKSRKGRSALDQKKFAEIMRLLAGELKDKHGNPLKVEVQLVDESGRTKTVSASEMLAEVSGALQESEGKEGEEAGEEEGGEMELALADEDEDEDDEDDIPATNLEAMLQFMLSSASPADDDMPDVAASAMDDDDDEDGEGDTAGPGAEEEIRLVVEGGAGNAERSYRWGLSLKRSAPIIGDSIHTQLLTALGLLIPRLIIDLNPDQGSLEWTDLLAEMESTLNQNTSGTVQSPPAKMGDEPAATATSALVLPGSPVVPMEDGPAGSATPFDAQSPLDLQASDVPAEHPGVTLVRSLSRASAAAADQEAMESAPTADGDEDTAGPSNKPGTSRLLTIDKLGPMTQYLLRCIRRTDDISAQTAAAELLNAYLEVCLERMWLKNYYLNYVPPPEEADDVLTEEDATDTELDETEAEDAEIEKDIERRKLARTTSTGEALEAASEEFDRDAYLAALEAKREESLARMEELGYDPELLKESRRLATTPDGLSIPAHNALVNEFILPLCFQLLHLSTPSGSKIWRTMVKGLSTYIEIDAQSTAAILTQSLAYALQPAPQYIEAVEAYMSAHPKLQKTPVQTSAMEQKSQQLSNSSASAASVMKSPQASPSSVPPVQLTTIADIFVFVQALRVTKATLVLEMDTMLSASKRISALYAAFATMIRVSRVHSSLVERGYDPCGDELALWPKEGPFLVDILQELMVFLPPKLMTLPTVDSIQEVVSIFDICDRMMTRAFALPPMHPKLGVQIVISRGFTHKWLGGGDFLEPSRSGWADPEVITLLNWSTNSTPKTGNLSGAPLPRPTSFISLLVEAVERTVANTPRLRAALASLADEGASRPAGSPTSSVNPSGSPQASSAVFDQLDEREKQILRFSCYTALAAGYAHSRLWPLIGMASVQIDEQTSSLGSAAVWAGRSKCPPLLDATTYLSPFISIAPTRSPRVVVPAISLPQNEEEAKNFPIEYAPPGTYTGYLAHKPSVAFVLASPFLQQLAAYLRSFVSTSLTIRKCAFAGMFIMLNRFESQLLTVGADGSLSDPLELIDAVMNAARVVIPTAAPLPPLATKATDKDEPTFLDLVNIHARAFATAAGGKTPLIGPLAAIFVAASMAALHDPNQEIRSSARLLVFQVATSLLRPPTRYPIYSIECNATADVEFDSESGAAPEPAARAAAVGVDMLPSRAYRRLVKQFMAWAGAKPCNSKTPPASIALSHAGVLGLCALVEAHAGDLPPHIPPILAFLAPHATAPAPIGPVVGETFASFRQNHREAWDRFFRHWFTPAELEAYSSVQYTPSYVA